MSTQLVTPTSATMPLIVIPATIDTLGPQLSRLPDEIIYQIFKILATTMFPTTSRFNTLINSKTFTILNHHYAINRIRKVSSAFAEFFMEAFYENFHFGFKHHYPLNLGSKYLTSFPAPVPHHFLRHHLRSMRIDIVLENYYFTPQTNFDVPHTSSIGRESRRITTVDQMMAFCPSARFLLQLTSEDCGFANLRFLCLHIHTDFRFFAVDNEYLRVLEKMRFVVTAGKVELVVTSSDESVGKDQEEVKKRIVVEE